MATATESRSSRSAEMLRDFLAEVRTTVEDRASSMVLYGPPGIGKTEFGAAIKNAAFLVDDKELGIDTLKRSGRVSADIPVFPPMKVWPDVLAALGQLAAADHPYKAIIIDTLGGLERLCHAYVCETLFRGDWGEKGFAGYGRGFESALPEWRLLLNAFDDCRDRGMSIVCLTHSIVKPHKNPLGEDFDRYVPDLHHKTWNLTHRWADAVFFANYYVEIDQSGKGKGGQHRIINTEYSAAFEAKNRHGLPPEIDMGGSGREAWTNVQKAMKEARK